MADDKEEFGFKRVELHKKHPLGTGSYGAVCKATCDYLLCAAKIMHPTLFDFSDSGARSLLAKFEQECRLLGAVKHPNIVQYLGTWHEPATGHLVLLMELCDESLTRFLESSRCSLPYHLQVNISHDIAIALAYLHSNGLIHRDLSSNNVLLIARNRAKVTDFGMSKFEQVNPRITPLTLCPGTLAYMSPEALEEPPHYSAKLDCFSWGVLAIQIMTQLYPNPGPRFQTVADPRYPVSIHLPVPDEDRRQSHIALIESTHPLLPLSKKCLSYKENDRPSAPEICEKLLELKQTPLYSQSMQQTNESAEVVEPSKSEHNHDATKQLMELEHELKEKSNHMLQLQNTLAEREKEIQELRQKLLNAQELQQTTTQNLQEKEMIIQDLKQTALAQKKQSEFVTEGKTARRDTERLVWKDCGKVPSEMLRGGTVVDGALVYCHSGNKKVIQSYNTTSGEWSTLPRCSYAHFSLALVNGLLTTIGGYDVTTTSALFSLVTTKGNQQWSKVFRSMPTSRCSAAVVCADTSLVVAGGDATGSNDNLDVVEVMNTATQQWSTASKLPYPHRLLSAAVNGDSLYLAGGYAPIGTTATYTCSLAELLQSPTRGGRIRALSFNKKPPVWNQIRDLPVSVSTLAVFNGQVLAIGGEDSSRKPTTAVYKYDDKADLWKVFSHMNSPRNRSLVAVAHEDQLIVIGGFGGDNSIEIGSIE